MHSGEGNGTPLQYSCLENLMGRGAWWAAVHGVSKSRTRLSDFTFTFHFHAMEKEMATHSRVLAWRIPGTAEPGGLPSMGSNRVGHRVGLNQLSSSSSRACADPRPRLSEALASSLPSCISAPMRCAHHPSHVGHIQSVFLLNSSQDRD